MTINRAIERTLEKKREQKSPETQRESQFTIGVIDRKYDLQKPFPFYQDEPLHIALKRNSEVKSKLNSPAILSRNNSPNPNKPLPATSKQSPMAR